MEENDCFTRQDIKGAPHTADLCEQDKIYGAAGSAKRDARFHYRGSEAIKRAETNN